MPAAIKSLRAHLGNGDPDAWRAALRVFEQAFGRPIEVVKDDDPHVSDPLDVAHMTRAQRDVLASRIIELHPELAALRPARIEPDP